MNLDTILDACPMRPGVHWRIHHLADLDAAMVIEAGRGLGFVVTALAEERDDWRDTIQRLCAAILASATVAPAARELDLDDHDQAPPTAPAEPREGS